MPLLAFFLKKNVRQVAHRNRISYLKEISHHHSCRNRIKITDTLLQYIDVIKFTQYKKMIESPIINSGFHL